MTTHQAQDGTTRQSHYGAGRQPWDDIQEQGWDIHFSAGNVLKYLRRAKAPEHSLESARWYWQRLRENPDPQAMVVMTKLALLLSDEEYQKLL